MKLKVEIQYDGRMKITGHTHTTQGGTLYFEQTQGIALLIETSKEGDVKSVEHGKSMLDFVRRKEIFPAHYWKTEGVLDITVETEKVFDVR